MSSQGPPAGFDGQGLVIPSIIANTPANNSGPTKAFVLACIDPRFINVVEQYLAAELGINGFTYDLFILAGGSLGGLNPTSDSSCQYVSASTNWKETLVEHITVARILHSVTKIYIFDHLDCGAYKLCNGDGGVPNGDSDTRSNHITKFEDLQTFLTGQLFAGYTFPLDDIKGFVIDDGSSTGQKAGDIYSISGPVGFLDRTYSIGTYSGANVLVLGCIDPRFSALLTAFLNGYKEVQFNYDLTILAGSSLGVNQSYVGGVGTNRLAGDDGNYSNSILKDYGPNWGPTFFDHVSIARFLHGVTEVWVFDHLDCGAYKNIKLASGGSASLTDNDIAPHTEELRKLQGYMSTYTQSGLGNNGALNPNGFKLAFKGFVMAMDGSITKVIDDGGGTSIGDTTYVPRGYTWTQSSIRDASDFTEFVRQQKTYGSYVGPTAPLNNRSEIYGCWFRLQYLLGRHKKGGCGNSGCVGGIAKQLKGELGDQ